MSEVHIRINKRFFERTIFVLIILGLVAALFFQTPTVQEGVSVEEHAQVQQELASAQEEITALQAEILLLQEEANSAEEETTPQEPVTEPETTVSGTVSVSWTVQSVDNRFTSAVTTFRNERTHTEEFTYRLTWRGFEENTVFHTGTIVVPSGEQRPVTFTGGEKTILSDPPDTVHTLSLRITDSSGNLVDVLEERVR